MQLVLHCALCCTVCETLGGNLGWWPKPIYTLLQPADIADGIAHCFALFCKLLCAFIFALFCRWHCKLQTALRLHFCTYTSPKGGIQLAQFTMHSAIYSDKSIAQCNVHTAQCSMHQLMYSAEYTMQSALCRVHYAL